jgi:hypothetical protein
MRLTRAVYGSGLISLLLKLRLEAGMKGLALLGVVVLILGIVSFLVPFPHYHHHGVRFGDSHVGITTEHDEKLPVAVGIVLVVVGAGLMIAGKSS